MIWSFGKLSFWTFPPIRYISDSLVLFESFLFLGDDKLSGIIPIQSTCLPWSVWIDKGHPNFVMNSLHTVFAHVGAVWSGTGYASAHLLKWSVRTSMCWFPCTDSGNGPTRSMDILSSRAPVRMSPRGARGLRLFHFWTHIAYFNPNVKIFSYLEPIESLL